LAVLVRTTLRSDFRRIDPTKARIVLIDAAPKVLGTFAPDLSDAAEKHLQKLGVEIRLGHAVEKIDNEGVIVAGERIASKTVTWTAGVAPSPAGKWLGAETDRAGRVRVQKDLSVAGHPEIFVIGDTASLDQDGKPLPGVAQVAMQQGRYLGKLIPRRVAGKNGLKPFRYFDKGNMAVVGKGYAILQSGKVRLHGLIAWFAWAFIHITFLAQVGLRISVFLQWAWLFLTGQRGSRLIVDYHSSEPIQTARPISAESKGVSQTSNAAAASK
jgi:NADH dehydrogenase